MTPTLSLGPYGAPSIEFMPRDIEPLIALVIETQSPLDKDALGSIYSFVSLDTLDLADNSSGFFRCLEAVCRQVVTGTLTRFDAAKIRASELDGYMRCVGDGSVTSGARNAAKRFLEFLEANPDHWPSKSVAG
jgi:hypothetical protein